MGGNANGRGLGWQFLKIGSCRLQGVTEYKQKVIWDRSVLAGCCPCQFLFQAEQTTCGTLTRRLRPYPHAVQGNLCKVVHDPSSKHIDHVLNFS